MFKTPSFFLKKSGSPTAKNSSKVPNTLATGQESERLAEQFLQSQGLTLVERNYRCKAGEIDLIMRDDEHLVFVEVRFRKSGRFGSASETIDSRKQQKVIRAAEHYLQARWRGSLPACRFDVIAIQGMSNPTPNPQMASHKSGNREKPTLNAQHPTKLQFSSTNRRQNPIEWIPNAFTL